MAPECSIPGCLVVTYRMPNGETVASHTHGVDQEAFPKAMGEVMNAMAPLIQP
jgi:hypothetical protein